MLEESRTQVNPTRSEPTDDVLHGREDRSQRAGIIAPEQRVIDHAYRLLDEQRDTARRSLDASLLDRGTGTPQSRSERDTLVSKQQARVRALDSVEQQLVFGRIDRADGRHYIGRLGLRDARRNTVVLDWRADAAAAFYAATTAHPQGVLLRRRLRIADRHVTDVFDDLIAPGHHKDKDVLPDSADAALMSVARRPRTGRMVDIVSTIQADQDAAIRAPLDGVSTVEGSPGTGKTVVALHRVAYLLHRHRDHLERHGVLIVGPGPRYGAYISHVLPGLGETSVTVATIPDLYPVNGPLGDDTPQGAALKGSEQMVPTLSRAVELQHRVPTCPIPLEVDGMTVWLRPDTVRAAQQRARDTGDPHNQARTEYCLAVLDDLADQLRGGEGSAGTDDRQLRRLLAGSPDVRREVNLCWMPRTPEQLLERLYADDAFLTHCTPTWTIQQRALLHRPRGLPWTADDLPLLDYLAEQLGPLPPTTVEAAAARAVESDHQDLTSYAADTLRVVGLDGMLSPQFLAARHAPVANELATADPVWGTYGHVVVDEAQDLSPMQWRMIARRCPSKSMTLVGDPHQATSPSASMHWPPPVASAANRTRRHTLIVNYRVPGRVMDAATRVLAAHTPAAPTVRSLRAGTPLQVVQCRDSDDFALVRRGADIAEQLAASAPGSVALVLPTHLAGFHSSTTTGADTAPPNLHLLAAPEVKGLEFDHLVLIEPGVLADDPALRGRLLYICLTRATQTVTLVHRRPLPEGTLTTGSGPTQPRTTSHSHDTRLRRI